MSDKDMLTDEQLNSLVTNGNLILQFEESGQRASVGLPFAVENCGGDWWLCCPQGKFKLCLNAPVLFSRSDAAATLHWVSILESYRAFLMFSGGEPEAMPIPAQLASDHADWLLGFLRQCVLVTVSEDPGIPPMPPETRVTVSIKPGAALTRIKQLTRRRGARWSQRQH